MDLELKFLQSGRAAALRWAQPLRKGQCLHVEGLRQPGPSAGAKFPSPSPNPGQGTSDKAPAPRQRGRPVVGPAGAAAPAPGQAAQGLRSEAAPCAGCCCGDGMGAAGRETLSAVPGAVSHATQRCRPGSPPREAPPMAPRAALRWWPGTMLWSRTGKCLLLPSAFGKTLTSRAAFSFPACSRFQGNKIPQARAEVSHLNVTQAENQSGPALPMAWLPAVTQGGCWSSCSPPGRTMTGTPVHHHYR